MIQEADIDQQIILVQNVLLKVKQSYALLKFVFQFVTEQFYSHIKLIIPLML